MKKVATAKQMQKIDTLASSSYGVSGLELMENAGTEIVKALKRRFHDFSSKRVLIFCGKGNNGGDGFVAARQLFNMNIQVKKVMMSVVMQNSLRHLIIHWYLNFLRIH